MLADRPHGRRLNADEQRRLDDLERRLLSGSLAPPRPVPVGLAAVQRRPFDVRLLLASVPVVAGLLVLAVVIGGPGGLVAVAVTLLATLLVCRLAGILFARPRPRLARPHWAH